MGRNAIKLATCHPDRKAEAKGLCKSCYIAQYYQANRDKIRVKAKQRYKDGGRDKWLPYYQKNRAKILARQKDYVNRNKEIIYAKNRKNGPKYRYGLSSKDYANLIISQGNCCKTCNTQFTSKLYPCVDHCHTTNKIRGILCDPCNKSLGILKENVETLRQLADYVERNK